MNKTKTILIAGTLVVLGAGGIIALQPDEKVKLDNPQQIVWQKPTTDAQWAEDVKVENFDVKPDTILQEMIDAHKAKLEKVLNNDKEMFECPECIRYKIKTANPEWSPTDIENDYQNQLNQATWDIEKLKQSIERMEKEMELRKAGKVDRKQNILQAKPSTEAEKQAIEVLKKQK